MQSSSSNFRVLIIVRGLKHNFSMSSTAIVLSGMQDSSNWSKTRLCFNKSSLWPFLRKPWSQQEVCCQWCSFHLFHKLQHNTYLWPFELVLLFQANLNIDNERTMANTTSVRTTCSNLTHTTRQPAHSRLVLQIDYRISVTCSLSSMLASPISYICGFFQYVLELNTFWYSSFSGRNTPRFSFSSLLSFCSNRLFYYPPACFFNRHCLEIFKSFKLSSNYSTITSLFIFCAIFVFLCSNLHRLYSSGFCISATLVFALWFPFAADVCNCKIVCGIGIFSSCLVWAISFDDIWRTSFCGIRHSSLIFSMPG